MRHYKIEALWDCVYCDNKGIKGRYQNCPSCGNPRGKEIKFYLPSDFSAQKAVDEKTTSVSKRPDWLCSYCGGYNHSDISFCRNCGAVREKEDKNYFQIQREP